MVEKAKITGAMKKALRALYQSGGDGVVSKQRVLASGEWLPFSGSTFLKLVGEGMVTMTGPRLALTPAGRALAEKQRPWVNYNEGE